MQNENTEKLESAYQYCLDLARQHYENFPTASIFLGKKQRKATAAIYAYARQADDLADEGNETPSARLRALDDYQHKLDQIYAGLSSNDPVFIALADVIRNYDIPQQTLADLLIAFRMDVTKNRYANFSELLVYCQHSANPVGELVLRLHQVYDEQNKIFSDRICTALQLINFIQDLDEDYQQRQRIYIPEDEMRQFGISEETIKNKTNVLQMEKLVETQLARAQNMLLSGSDLVNALDGKLRFVMKLTICSGNRICEKLRSRANCYARPTLTLFDWIKIGLQMFYFRSLTARAKIQHTLQ